MSSHYEAPIRKPLVIGDKSYHDITEDIARPIETPPNKDWWIAFGISMACLLYTSPSPRDISGSRMPSSA